MYSLSKKSGKLIACDADGTNIYLNENSFDNSTDNQPFDLIDDRMIRNLVPRKVSPYDIKYLRESIKKREPPNVEYLVKPYYHLLSVFEESNQKEIKNLNNCMVAPGKKRNRFYIAGSSGCGKSTFIYNYAKIFLRQNPDFKVIVFSDVEPSQDIVLSKLNPIRITLNDQIVTEPIEPHEIANSFCIFDDVDSIQNKKIRQAVEALSDSCFHQGSTKANIELCVSRHASSDHKATRASLINANYFTYYPASKVGLSYTLAKFGLNKEQIQKAVNLPSRYCILHTQTPQYIIYQSGVYLL